MENKLESTELTLTKEQQDIVDYTGNEILIRGIAGSGKTLVLLKKAKQTALKYPNEKVAIFTFAGALSNATKFLIEKYNLANLEVKTFHSWAMSMYPRVMKKKLYLTKGNQQDVFFKRAIQNLSSLNHRFVNNEDFFDFLKDEIKWIKGKGISTLNEYLDVNRKGRGTNTRVTMSDREIIYQVFDQYNKEKDYLLDFDDLAVVLMKNQDKIPDWIKYDHIFIDEAQDLQQIQLQVLKHIARKSFIVAADKGQKIYKTSFTWKEIGLNVTGNRTKILKDSYRSTKQIIQLAASLQQHDKVIYDEEYVIPTLPEREGPISYLMKCKTVEAQDKEIIKSVKKILEKNSNCTIGILYREGASRNSAKNRIQRALNEVGLLSEDIRANGNPHTPGIKLCTFHSAKGLEFDFVFIIDLIEPTRIPDENQEENYWEIERRLLYVSITRARVHLQLFTYGNTLRLIKELDSDFYKSFTL
ncbi:UvrD-helicase domain-containing protein [Bacillus sp. UNC322MFChir4.1]|uniref:UvrD-helicase domain-containing protein n=1 Tax=Bacillus sp. UNC322MFChir4.1 TaxID=1449045 RepID=UPI0005577922|nr:UvrD-helicase domain-containing protein [Bacillus sp. UNC322MFChir4.1]